MDQGHAPTLLPFRPWRGSPTAALPPLQPRIPWSSDRAGDCGTASAADRFCAPVSNPHIANVKSASNGFRRQLSRFPFNTFHRMPAATLSDTAGLDKMLLQNSCCMIFAWCRTKPRSMVDTDGHSEAKGLRGMESMTHLLLVHRCSPIHTQAINLLQRFCQLRNRAAALLS